MPLNSTDESTLARATGKKARSPHFYSALGLGMFALALWAISRQLQDYRHSDILQGLNHINRANLGGAIALTILSYLAISGYDILAFHYLGSRLEKPKIALAGFVTYAISPSLGFAFITGSALRYRLYASWGVSAIDIARVVVFSNLSLWVGILAIAGLVFTFDPLPLPEAIALPAEALPAMGRIFLGLTAIYLLLCTWVRVPLRVRSQTYYLPSLNVALLQIIVFALDWGFAAAALYCLLNLFAKLSYLKFLSIYVIGMVVGLISAVPGGLGVFETVLLFFLSPFIPNSQTLAVLLVFRSTYYLLPAIAGIGLLGWFEFQQRARAKR